MEPPELPECPVCLQSYEAVSTIPRVLACGHSACETCLTQLPKPFPDSIRCPACTQLVKYPHPQGPSALPKNIDLLRLSSLLENLNSRSPPKPTKLNEQLASNSANGQQFIPNLWSYEFYLEWKDWVLPQEAVLVESNTGDDDGFCSVLYGKIVSSQVLGSLGLSIRCLLNENRNVSLVRVGLCSYENDDSKFSYSYIYKAMRVLYGMKDGERDELGLILRGSLKQRSMCKVYGLWYNTNNRCMYIVCENYTGKFWKNLDDSEDRSIGEDEEKIDSGIGDDMSRFAMIGMEICEAISGLHSVGLIAGCLSMSCFNFDDFGHVYVDFNEVMAAGRRVHRMIANDVVGKQKIDGKELEVRMENDVLNTYTFVSPELLLELLQKEDYNLGSSGSRYVVGYGSDVWSLACVLLWLLIGKPFAEKLRSYFDCLICAARGEKGSDYMGSYMGWMEKVVILLETRLGSEFISLKEVLCKCLNFDAQSRPFVIDLWKYIRELIIKPHFNKMVILEQVVAKEKAGHCLVLGELCKLLKETNKESERYDVDGLQKKDENGRVEVDQVGELKVDKDLVEGLSGGHIKCIDLKAHLDCITGLAVGGGFLFSSSFDKTVHVWSLQDFTHIHSFKGHEHRIMAVVFVDEEQPLCISGDNGGGICIWGITVPFGQEPIKKLNEEKDWRYSGIHALAVSGAGYLYTGSGDKLIKVWSLRDYTLSCIMNGHKSVVSTLSICNGVLYSGSWDGTVRLWCLSDHSPLAVLGEDTPGNVTSILSLAADQHALIGAHENGCIQIWSNDVFIKSTQVHKGAIFSVRMEGKWLFTGGWDKFVHVQELSRDESHIDAIPIGSIACSSVITALLYWQGKLFVGQADRTIKVYYYGV